MKTETGKNSLGVWESWNLNRLSGAFNVEYTGGRRCAKMASLRKVRYDLLHWHPTQCRAGLPLRLAHQRRALDQIGTFRKMMIYEKPGDRFIVMLSAGNLSARSPYASYCKWETLRPRP